MTSKVQVLCWGHTNLGQLGLGDIHENIVAQPRTSSFFSSKTVQEVACGRYHTAFVLQDGSVYTCGSNIWGQLGHEKAGYSPEQVAALDAQTIVHTSCGEAHTVALNDQGQVFSWGAGRDGQLGIDSTEETIRIPRLIRTLSGCVVIQVTCGSWHCMALTKDGRLFAWGQNAHGQLGLGKGYSSQTSPQCVKSLTGIPLAQIATGGMHSFTLSLSGAVFGWGRNNCGQLGLSDDKDRDVPNHVKFLRRQKIVYISCGEEHTAALTKSGGVFTFGAGLCGQLGHNFINNEINPRRVQELMGSEVSQISCGRQHTIAFVPSSGVIYAFGRGNRGQLGSGCTVNSQVPYKVAGNWVTHTHKLHPNDRSKYCVLKHVCCGGDQSFALFFQHEHSQVPDDFRRLDPQMCVRIINSHVNRWMLSLSGKDVLNELNAIFSSPACLNGSFLDAQNDEHFKTSPRNPGIDLKAARLFFEKMVNSPYAKLLQQVTVTLENRLISQLPTSPPDVEAMRAFLILPVLPLFQDAKNYLTFALPFAAAILHLDANPSKVLDNWWCWVDAGYFCRLVELYKDVVLYLITRMRTALLAPVFSHYIIDALQVLEKLHKVNLIANHIDYEVFYIRELSNLVNIETDFLYWASQHAGVKIQPAIAEVPIAFCSYPFVLNAQAKTKMLQTDAALQMQIAVNRTSLENIFMLLTLGPFLTSSPFLVLHVQRTNLVSDALRELSIHSDVDLKKPLKVVFLGEEAVDDGGVTKEFFLLLLKELLDPKYGMFTYYEQSRLLWFSEKTFVELNWFHLIGILCGLAIYNFTVVDLHFPLVLYKKLLNVKPTLEDLKELSPTEGRSLQELLDYPGDNVEETFCLSFAILRENYGVAELQELIPGGKRLPVRKDNRKEFVQAYVDYIFNNSVQELFSAFSSGFLKVCGGKVLQLFQPSELMAMVVGNTSYNWKELEMSAIYKGDYHPAHPTIKIFWEVFHDFPLEKKKLFLLFLTGSDRIPIYGMASIRMTIQPTAGGERYLPVAHTCYNLLDLPKYTSKAALITKLTQAIDHHEGFSLV
ncbi:probable E3 ubiquitin-protein ligase HERC3 [Scyliorhinus canicula]|uniref:probable E3 ubiquitin-protein ligase HERC3 n=1 Tax=Scyliorhinus canicula TaxID=7830 RepID=UPI0018F6376B|nr:probable E3 ubiquitin-protein ligase HERC3 [Scyliorhinus canicula]XP_038648656.1 probable E3 ubiquitin-protein ligase HERC3 [Scyliorhinus canicula]